MNEFFYFVFSGFILMLIPFAFIGGVWLRGFFFTFLKVKASGGRRCMVRGWNLTHWRFVAGEVKDGFLTFKHLKETHRIEITGSDFYRMLKLDWVDVDFTDNTITRRQGERGTPFDAVKFDNLFVRCLFKPTIGDTKTTIIIALLAFCILLALVSLGLSYQTYEMVKGLGSITQATVGII